MGLLRVFLPIQGLERFSKAVSVVNYCFHVCLELVEHFDRDHIRSTAGTEGCSKGLKIPALCFPVRLLLLQSGHSTLQRVHLDFLMAIL